MLEEGSDSMVDGVFGCVTVVKKNQYPLFPDLNTVSVLVYHLL
jgi:hypothetical protein